MGDRKVVAVVNTSSKASDTLLTQILDWTLRRVSTQPAKQP